MSARTERRKHKRLELVPAQVAPESLPTEAEISKVAADPALAANVNSVAEQDEKGADMQTSPVSPVALSPFSRDVVAANAAYAEAESVPPMSFTQRIMSLAQRCRDSLRPGHGAALQARSATAEALDQGRSVMADQSMTQINDRDREHMQSFPGDVKAQLLSKINSLQPIGCMVSNGSISFEKAMINIHREGYALIDLDPYETAFSSVWYRKSRKLRGGVTEVIMLMWEENENSDTTTVRHWEI